MLLIICGRAYSADDPARLLMQQVTLAYLSLSSYHAKADVTDDTEFNGFYTSTSVTIEVFWSDPNRRRVDTITPTKATSSALIRVVSGAAIPVRVTRSP